MATKEKLNILVVDDSQTVREILTDELKALGQNVQAAPSAEKADVVLQQAVSQIDVVLLDLKLPGMEGMDFLSKIRAKNKEIIVIIMTAYETADSAVEAIERGANDYVIKPIEPRHLDVIVRRAIKLRGMEKERARDYDNLQKFVKDAEENSEMTRLFIGELKDEVNRLLGELGRSAKYKV